MTRFRWRNPQTLRSSRVTTLELFFDLVFVFTLTQLTAMIEHDMTPAGLGRAVLLFGVLWYMHGGYAWLTNHVPPVRPSQRLLLLAGMSGFLVTAIALPHAFDDDGVVFGVGFVMVVCIHLALFSQSDATAGLVRLAPFNLLAAGLVLAAEFAHGTLMYVLWCLALGILIVTPYLGVAPRFQINAAHFVERHGLLIIVALGESVVAIGVAVRSMDVTTSTAALVVLALALPAALWWAYFSGDDDAAERTLDRADAARRGLLAIRGYFYAHVPILMGIVVTAAGIHEAIAHPGESLPTPAALALAGGVTLFFLGDVEFRRVLDAGEVVPRLVVAAVVLLTVPLGTAGVAWLQIVAIVVIVASVLAVEQRRSPALTVETLA